MTYVSLSELVLLLIVFFFFLIFCLFRAILAAHGGSHARSWTGAAATGLHHSHSNAGSLTHWGRPGIESATWWVLVRFVSTEPRWELRSRLFFFFWSHLQHMDVPRPGTEPPSLQWQHWILNPLCHKRTPPVLFLCSFGHGKALKLFEWKMVYGQVGVHEK